MALAHARLRIVDADAHMNCDDVKLMMAVVVIVSTFSFVVCSVRTLYERCVK